MTDAIPADVQLLGVELSKEDRERVSAAMGAGFRVRWSVPSGAALSVDDAQRAHSAFLVRLGLSVHKVVSPRGGEAAGGDVWRGVEQLISGIWQGQAAADSSVMVDVYVVFELANDLVAIKFLPPDPPRVEATLNAQLESLSGQWDSILREVQDQTRGPVMRIYVLSDQDDRWTLRTPEESEGFLRVLMLEV